MKIGVASAAEISEVVAMYVRSRLNPQRPISTADAVRAIRTAAPRCVLNDRQLSQMVARAAVKHRHPVIFDEIVPGDEEL